MAQERQIVVDDLTKRYGEVVAVDHLSFTVEPGRVTGYLGPNGAGETTTMRMVLGLVQPTSGNATIGGRRYLDIDEPTQAVGAVLEASSAHRGRTGRNHLKAACIAAELPLWRADEVLELVRLAAAGDRVFRGYSLGMRQRLGIATAMIGDPGVLVLDEPANGLDPEGIRWMRELLRGLAADGRTVLVSSHLLTEMQSLADDVVIVANGRLVRSGPVGDVVASMSHQARVELRTTEPERLADALVLAGGVVDLGATMTIAGLSEQAVGDTAYAAGIPIHRLGTQQADLEEVFLEPTHGKGGIR
jgi:ABC-2 type transport system ATP-binding protein